MTKQKNCACCGKTFSAIRATARYCSEKCKKAAQRPSTSRKRLTQADRIERALQSPFGQWLLATVKRSGTWTLNGVDLRELYDEYQRFQRLRSACHDPKPEIAHYHSLKHGGLTSPSNLGLWPAALNRKFGSRSLSHIGESWDGLTESGGNDLAKTHGVKLAALQKEVGLQPSLRNKLITKASDASGLSRDELGVLGMGGVTEILDKAGIQIPEKYEPDRETYLTDEDIIRIEFIRQFGYERAAPLRHLPSRTLARYITGEIPMNDITISTDDLALLLGNDTTPHIELEPEDAFMLDDGTVITYEEDIHHVDLVTGARKVVAFSGYRRPAWASPPYGRAA